MSEREAVPPKRRYDNTLRQAQARATKALVIDAATELFVERGYAATNIEGIAELAGVPIATVYRLLGSKATMLAEVLGTTISDEPVLEVSPSATAEELLAEAARFTCDLHGINGDLYGVLCSAASADADAGALLVRTDERRLEGHAALGHALAERGALADGVTAADAVDLLHALLSVDVHRLLTRDRRWTDDRYEAWLVSTLRSQLLR